MTPPQRLTKQEKIERMEKIYAQFLNSLGDLRVRRRRIVDLLLRRLDEQKIQSLIKALKR